MLELNQGTTKLSSSLRVRGVQVRVQRTSDQGAAYFKVRHSSVNSRRGIAMAGCIVAQSGCNIDYCFPQNHRRTIHVYSASNLFLGNKLFLNYLVNIFFQHFVCNMNASI